MHDTLFEHQHTLADEDLVGLAAGAGADADAVRADLEAGTFSKRVRDDFRSGVKSGVNGTPTFFVNGERHDGAWADEGAFIRALERIADAAGATPAHRR
jgi:predicted DsbA family dithiol-disulfide isomerase